MTCNHDCQPCRCAAEGEQRKQDSLATFEGRRETILTAGRRVSLCVLPGSSGIHGGSVAARCNRSGLATDSQEGP